MMMSWTLNWLKYCSLSRAVSYRKFGEQMQIKICVVTGTRADYHLLYPLLRAMKNDKEFKLFLAVTGSHLSGQYGNTYQDIEQDGFVIDTKIPILQEKDGPNEINIAMGAALAGFNTFFGQTPLDMVILLGDRYELLSAAIAAMNYQIPISHIHGGETTEGAIDECIRHAVTKMSYLHFTSCEEYRKRVIQLGESPERVFNVGALGLENIKKLRRMSLEELEKSLDFSLERRFAVVTYHPVTLEKNTAKEEFGQVLEALDQIPDLKIIFTKSNADSGGLCINRMIDDYVKRRSKDCISVFSLGMIRYLSALSYAAVIIGNSSSGIIETPSFCVPVVNIGDRQKGRIQAKNILNCRAEKKEILYTVLKAVSKEFYEYVQDTKNPYGDGNASAKILFYIKSYFHGKQQGLKKSFYNIDFHIE